MKKLIRNSIRTPDGTVLESTHRHDYQTHIDKVTGDRYMVDGGLSYQRGSINIKPAEDLSLYNDEPHEVQRDVIKWGTRGKDGTEPLKRTPIKAMETEHIQAVLADWYPMGVIAACMRKELEFRDV